MGKANQDIRNYSKDNRVPMWRVAEELKISESVLCRRLRHELPEEQKTEIRAIIGKLATID